MYRTRMLHDYYLFPISNRWIPQIEQVRKVWPTADRIDGDLAGGIHQCRPVWTRLEKADQGDEVVSGRSSSTEHGKTSESEPSGPQERTMVPVQVTYPARRCNLDLPLQPMGLARPWSAAMYPPTHCTASPQVELQRVHGVSTALHRRPNVPQHPPGRSFSHSNNTSERHCDGSRVRSLGRMAQSHNSRDSF